MDCGLQSAGNGALGISLSLNKSGSTISHVLFRLDPAPLNKRPKSIRDLIWFGESATSVGGGKHKPMNR
jgi:hypothetical protein